jgi:transcriptional regulator with XRE-family HTH domain
VSNADDERREPTRTYDNRGIPLPGLRPARQRFGLTQRELASRAGLGQGTICKLERSERGAYPQTLQKLALALGVTPADLVEGRVDQKEQISKALEREDPALGLSTTHIGPQGHEPTRISPS